MIIILILAAAIYSNDHNFYLNSGGLITIILILTAAVFSSS
jgi:hypothetical protein